jgi:hypothetical protein
MVDCAVFGLLVYFNLGVVGTKMALVASLGLPGLHNREFVPGVTAGAAAKASVWIDPANSHVGPGSRDGPSVDYLYHGAVTSVTSAGPFDGIIHPIVEPVINFPYDFMGVSVFALGVLFGFFGMTASAILWSHHNRYGIGIVL